MQHALSSVLDDIKKCGDENTVSAGELVDAFQERSLGVLLTVYGLITSLPVIGGIPGVSVAMGLLIILAVVQFFVGGQTMWVPDFVRRREVSRDKVDRAIEAARPWVERVDFLLKRRLTVLSAGRVQHAVIGIAAALLALTFVPLAIVPYGVTPPALAVLAFGLGVMARDGLLVLIGYALCLATAYLLIVGL